MADFATHTLHSAAGATGNGTAMNVRNAAAVMLHFQNVGTPVGTVSFEGTLSPDAAPAATDWFPIAMREAGQTTATTLVINTTTPGAYVLPRECALAQIRAVVTRTSGAFTVVGTWRSI